MKQGLFIAIEGIDGSGKTTVAQRLFQKLKEQKFDVLLTKEPGGTALGAHIRSLIQNDGEEIDPKAEFLLFAADRAQHFSHTILPALDQKKIILSDRGADSSVAYQGYGRGLDVGMIKNVNRWAMADTSPDLTLYIQVDYKTARTRMVQRGKVLTAFEKERRAFFERVITGFNDLYAGRDDVIIIDGTLPIDEVIEVAFLAVLEKVKAQYHA